MRERERVRKEKRKCALRNGGNMKPFCHLRRRHVCACVILLLLLLQFHIEQWQRKGATHPVTLTTIVINSLMKNDLMQLYLILATYCPWYPYAYHIINIQIIIDICLAAVISLSQTCTPFSVVAVVYFLFFYFFNSFSSLATATIAHVSFCVCVFECYCCAFPPN